MKKFLATALLLISPTVFPAWLNVVDSYRETSYYTGTMDFCEKILIRESKKLDKRYFWISCSIKPLPGAKRVFLVPGKSKYRYNF